MPGPSVYVRVMTQREIVVGRTRSSGWKPNAQIIRLRVKKLWGSSGFSFLGAEGTTVTYGWGMARLYPRICGLLLRRLRAGVHLKLDTAAVTGTTRTCAASPECDALKTRPTS
jgi:hypothetical protein